MGCCGPNPIGSGTVAIDACKRVNYTLGMLLGVDDFVQESTYHTARRHALAREALGYGTVRGLDVVVEPDGDKGPRLRVTPGVALLPSGTPVCVDSEQCSNLNDWLAAHATQVEQALSADSPPANIVLHAVLSYTQCLTDNVPIPGEPCRSEDDLMKPSRIADGFRLELRLHAPPQREEDAVRDFVDWLARIPVVADSPPLDEEQFIKQLRDAAHAWLEPTSPPATPGDFMFGAPAGSLRADEGLLRAALRLWTTELRPLWMARADCGCSAQQSAGADDAVLLATLDVPLVAIGSGWRVSDVITQPVLIDQSRRPVLLSLRMVQELIAQNPTPEACDTVVSSIEFGLLPDAGSASEYSRADHTHGTPELPPLSGDLDGSLGDADSMSPPRPPLVVGLRGRRLADIDPAPNQTLIFDDLTDTWKPGDVEVAIPELGGDLTGTISSATLTRLQGKLVDATAPGPNDVLRFIGGKWVPAAAGNFVGRTAGLYEIVAAGEIQVDLRNGDSSPSAISSYGGITPSGGRGGDTKSHTLIDLTARVPNAEKISFYVVKLTAIWVEGSKVEFKLYLFETVQPSGDTIKFTVMLSAESPIVEGDFRFRFQVEVSRFGKPS